MICMYIYMICMYKLSINLIASSASSSNNCKAILPKWLWFTKQNLLANLGGLGSSMPNMISLHRYVHEKMIGLGLNTFVEFSLRTYTIVARKFGWETNLHFEVPYFSVDPSLFLFHICCHLLVLRSNSSYCAWRYDDTTANNSTQPKVLRSYFSHPSEQEKHRQMGTWHVLQKIYPKGVKTKHNTKSWGQNCWNPSIQQTKIKIRTSQKLFQRVDDMYI